MNLKGVVQAPLRRTGCEASIANMARRFSDSTDPHGIGDGRAGGSVRTPLFNHKEHKELKEPAARPECSVLLDPWVLCG